jgi:hypothetical protein
MKNNHNEEDCFLKKKHELEMARVERARVEVEVEAEEEEEGIKAMLQSNTVIHQTGPETYNLFMATHNKISAS